MEGYDGETVRYEIVHEEERQPGCCPVCALKAPAGATTCPACGSAVVSDTGDFSFVEKFVYGRKPGDPLESCENYQLLQAAANGIMDGSMSADAYLRALAKLHCLTEDALNHLDSEGFKQNLSSEAARSVGVELRNAFLEVMDGLALMAQYPQTHNPVDLQAGRKNAERGFSKVDDAAREALGLDD